MTSLSPETIGVVSHAILMLAAVAVAGLTLGSFRVRGIGLGAAGVLFAGIVLGHLGVEIPHEVSGFAKEFGLVLFVFTIGLQLGPGIVQLWRKQGLTLNGLAVSVVLQGLALVLVFRYLGGFEPLESAGLFSGATTNTPSLGAAVQAASERGASDTDLQRLAGVYALTYPGAIVGIIGAMLILRASLGIDPHQEAARASAEGPAHEPIQRRTLLIDNYRLAGMPFGDIPGVEETGVRLSRLRRANEETVRAANAETPIHPGDLIQVVGTRPEIDRFTPLIGQPSDVDLMTLVGAAESRKVYVTEPRALNKPLDDLGLDAAYSATVTRVIRSGVEMTPSAAGQFHYGDVARVVGDKEALQRVAEFLGDSAKAIHHTPFLPVFLGIALGVLIGITPIQAPGVPFPIRLGLAGGPLVAAIALSMLGRVGSCVWYIPLSANLAIRELGIILFLACVGLSAGKTFFATAFSSDGAACIAAGAVVTLIPLLTTGFFAHAYLKQNYLTICGVIAGSMTDPPALAFANAQADSEACSTAYAAVYPLTMILRIVAAQAIVLLST